MKTILPILLLSTLSLCRAGESADRLVGSWRSNRELSMSTFHPKKEVSEETRARITDLFGRLIVAYTPNQVSLRMADERSAAEAQKYSVVAETSDTIKIRYQDPKTKNDLEQEITFVGKDRYWISIDKADFREYFDRVPTRAE